MDRNTQEEIISLRTNVIFGDAMPRVFLRKGRSESLEDPFCGREETHRSANYSSTVLLNKLM